MNKYKVFENCECVDIRFNPARLPTALLIQFATKSCGFWIPYSLIGRDSEVFRKGDKGSLVLETWKAIDLGLIEEEPKRPLPRKGEREARTVKAILSILRERARILRKLGSVKEAICLCGECGEDPIAWHVAHELERVAKLVEDACED